MMSPVQQHEKSAGWRLAELLIAAVEARRGMLATLLLTCPYTGTLIDWRMSTRQIGHRADFLMVTRSAQAAQQHRWPQGMNTAAFAESWQTTQSLWSCMQGRAQEATKKHRL